MESLISAFAKLFETAGPLGAMLLLWYFTQRDNRALFQDMIGVAKESVEANVKVADSVKAMASALAGHSQTIAQHTASHETLTDHVEALGRKEK